MAVRALEVKEGGKTMLLPRSMVFKSRAAKIVFLVSLVVSLLSTYIMVFSERGGGRTAINREGFVII